MLTNSGSHSIFPEVTTDKYSKLDVNERERERRWRKYPCYNEDGEILWLETWRKREREHQGSEYCTGYSSKQMLFSCERYSHHAFDFFFYFETLIPGKAKLEIGFFQWKVKRERLKQRRFVNGLKGEKEGRNGLKGGKNAPGNIVPKHHINIVYTIVWRTSQVPITHI